MLMYAQYMTLNSSLDEVQCFTLLICCQFAQTFGINYGRIIHLQSFLSLVCQHLLSPPPAETLNLQCMVMWLSTTGLFFLFTTVYAHCDEESQCLVRW